MGMNIRGSLEEALFQPLHFPLKTEAAGEGDGDNRGRNCSIDCLICSETFGDGKKFCQHLVLEHKLVIADSKLIAHLKGYADYWRNRFQLAPYTEICSQIVLNAKNDDSGAKEEVYLLSSAIPEDKALRDRLKRKRLEVVLEQHDRERRDKNFERTCLFCKKKFVGNRDDLFKHMADDHNLSFGHPDNLVFVHAFLDLLESKLEKDLLCLFCEKTFKDRTILKEHMRKKLHKKINPKNTEYDKFYLINYLEMDKNWENVHAEDDSEIQEMGDEKEEMWGDWYDKEMGSVCLFCNQDFATTQEILKHMMDTHAFNMQELTRLHGLTYYEQVKLINYIRRQMIAKSCIGCLRTFPDSEELSAHLKKTKHVSFLPDTLMWDQPQYFFPTYENDNLLCALEDNAYDLDRDIDIDVDGTAMVPSFNSTTCVPTSDDFVVAEQINVPLDSILWNESIREQLG